MFFEVVGAPLGTVMMPTIASALSRWNLVSFVPGGWVCRENLNFIRLWGHRANRPGHRSCQPGSDPSGIRIYFFRQAWDEVARVIASIHDRIVSASLMLHRLGSYARRFSAVPKTLTLPSQTAPFSGKRGDFAHYKRYRSVCTENAIVRGLHEKRVWK